MKAVAMMKKAIKDSELNGYKWTADKKGLHWEYCNVNFTITIDEEPGMVKFEDENTGVYATSFKEDDEQMRNLIPEFCETYDEAIYTAAKMIIRKANNRY